jgi:hypothetical protein
MLQRAAIETLDTIVKGSGKAVPHLSSAAAAPTACGPLHGPAAAAPPTPRPTPAPTHVKHDLGMGRAAGSNKRHATGGLEELERRRDCSRERTCTQQWGAPLQRTGSTRPPRREMRRMRAPAVLRCRPACSCACAHSRCAVSPSSR